MGLSRTPFEGFWRLYHSCSHNYIIFLKAMPHICSHLPYNFWYWYVWQAMGPSQLLLMSLSWALSFREECASSGRYIPLIFPSRQRARFILPGRRLLSLDWSTPEQPKTFEVREHAIRSPFKPMKSPIKSTLKSLKLRQTPFESTGPGTEPRSSSSQAHCGECGHKLNGVPPYHGWCGNGVGIAFRNGWFIENVGNMSGNVWNGWFAFRGSPFVENVWKCLENASKMDGV